MNEKKLETNKEKQFSLTKFLQHSQIKQKSTKVEILIINKR